MLDPLSNNLFDLPGYEETEDEMFPPLPPPSSPGRDDVEGVLANEASDGNAPSQTKDSTVSAQKAIKRPIPKLDAQRLISERGLPALRRVFDNVKFKGKGRETEDLKTLLRHMEHWAHRLFPKLQFEDFIERVESLGNKKEVQTCLKRIRLDLPILHEDFTNNEGMYSFMQPAPVVYLNINLFSVFTINGKNKKNTNFTNRGLIKLNNSITVGSGGGNNRLQMIPEDLDPFSENMKEEFDSHSSMTLTEEQQQRIEKNRLLALERRQAKMQINNQSQENDLSATQPNGEFKTVVAQDPDDPTEVEIQAAEAKVDDMEAVDEHTELKCAEEIK
ncbi:TIMELESS-interacting protein isoform X1 [Carettochelys insculpta]|uniref:TIMELESS-interacting protein isoform X1 n=1 Tax=Carettochelys insculpta TaxID=44489 RepID=UPI003EBC1C85